MKKPCSREVDTVLVGERQGRGGGTESSVLRPDACLTRAAPSLSRWINSSASRPSSLAAADYR